MLSGKKTTIPQKTLSETLNGSQQHLRIKSKQPYQNCESLSPPHNDELSKKKNIFGYNSRKLSKILLFQHINFIFQNYNCASRLVRRKVINFLKK
jgi:hypothetical protein